MKKVRAITQLIFFTFISFFISFALGIDTFAGKDSEGWTSLKEDVYINGKSIAYPSNHTVSLWVKVVPDEDNDILLEVREQLMNKGRDDKALAYLYSGILAEIDCSKNSHRKLLTILYDANKNIIHSADHPQASWTTITPGSSFHLVQTAVCRESLPVATHKYDVVRSGC
jgi:hypothetical protein